MLKEDNVYSQQIFIIRCMYEFIVSGRNNKSVWHIIVH